MHPKKDADNIIMKKKSMLKFWAKPGWVGGERLALSYNRNIVDSILGSHIFCTFLHFFTLPTLVLHIRILWYNIFYV